ncbi:unnamed protein product [Spirodela intermedia]|uniref:Uncharacterized protein n=1 Tax=Spirodela intermedia TaxID=51605 RepID=A0A7I8JKN3_SPIIN|nr:unnamed protein product [Spirodela intermedia]CAA6670391.1 unnamed protein product [Spirodela intermedia]
MPPSAVASAPALPFPGPSSRLPPATSAGPGSRASREGTMFGGGGGEDDWAPRRHGHRRRPPGWCGAAASAGVPGPLGGHERAARCPVADRHARGAPRCHVPLHRRQQLLLLLLLLRRAAAAAAFSVPAVHGGIAIPGARLAALDRPAGLDARRRRVPPSVFAYNVVLRNALRAGQWALAAGLFGEMRTRHALAPDRYSYATLISALGKAGRLEAALSWLHRMERDGVRADLVLYSTLIELARKLGDHAKAAGLLQEARGLLAEMEEEEEAVRPDMVSYSTLLTAYVENRRYVEALSLFSHMRERRVPPDLTTCNIMIDVYGQLGMPREADRLFWSMRRLGVEPSVVSYNTLLRVYGEAELFGEAVHLFRLMQRKGAVQNVVTYNTMIAIYGRSLEHEKAGNLVQEMQRAGVQPNSIDRAAALFQKLRTSGVEIDPVLYQTMIAVYERAGLVAHARRLLSDLNDPDDEGKIPRETAVKILARADRVEEAARLFRRAVSAGSVKDITVFQCMMDLFARNRRHRSVVEVLENMRAAGYLPDSAMIGMALHAYGKLQEFTKAESLYREMQEEGCVLPDKVHFQMLSLLGARRDFARVESLLAELSSDPNVNKRELQMVAAGVYERGTGSTRRRESSRAMPEGARLNVIPHTPRAL